MMNRYLTAPIAVLTLVTAMAQEAPFGVAPGLFDATDGQTMGLDYASEAETVTVWAAQDAGNHYANGVVMTAFHGALYCMWQTSADDEDADDTYVAYARSTDAGQTWSEPMVLCPTISDGYCASGGWLASDDLLVAYINVRTKQIANSGGYTQYMESTDGLTWSEPRDVTMAGGAQLNGIFEQDPHTLADGRIVCAAHFQPGLMLCPIYTDDPTGRTGWRKGAFEATPNGTQSAELEPSFYTQADGTLVMVMRDQKSSYHTLASTSTDRGATWTKAVKTDMPDSRAKQCAGNLPDGTAFIVNNPGRVTTPVAGKATTWRVPLALTLSADGTYFDHSYLLRSGAADDYPDRRYEGKSKTLGYSYPKALVHDGYLYVSYSVNKDDVQYTRVPVRSVALAIDDLAADGRTPYQLIGRRLTLGTSAADITVSDMRGACVCRLTQATEADLSPLPAGLYTLRVGSQVRKVLLR